MCSVGVADGRGPPSSDSPTTYQLLHTAWEQAHQPPPLGHVLCLLGPQSPICAMRRWN